MAEPLQRVVHKLSGSMLLYCPSAKADEFQNAVAYLVRRLDENTAPENFLRSLFNLQPKTTAWNTQNELFIQSCLEASHVSSNPRRTQNRLEKPEQPKEKGFLNEPDTDWSLSQNRQWAQAILDEWKNKKIPNFALVLAKEKEIELALETARKATSIPLHEMLSILSIAAQKFREQRSTLIGAMVTSTSKTIPVEADVEVSEAIDFIEYYLRNLKNGLS